MTPTPPGGGRPNHLAGQTSPYLLQHLHNPVDWYPWSPEALERARREDKPIFLSIGYAACHWCHVMERESFEDREIADYLNRHFVAIKVDREERPDLDEIYMNAVQMMTGQGGWPLNVFLTPDLEPFVGGTYFPPTDRHGRLGFPVVLRRIHEAWTDRREEIGSSAREMAARLAQIGEGPAGDPVARPIGRSEVARAVGELTGRFDSRWGGFGGAPKFPPDGAIALLLHEHAASRECIPLEMAEVTLERMALGGIYDHVGGGFARYSVDERWLVPHFEKMLYNQALLVPLYVDAWLINGKPLYRRVVGETLDFVRRELTAAEGGFYSSLDADSEGREGAFYVWTPQEVTDALGEEDGRLFRDLYGVTEEGNFEGRSIANLLGGSLADRAAALQLEEQGLVERLEPLRRRLLAVRERRERPATDDKILTAWNGLMITAFARAYQVFGRDDDLLSARRAAEFVLGNLLCAGRLRVSHREGQSRLNGYLDDYAFLARGLVDLYEASFERRFLDAAEQLARALLAHFEDGDRGGFFFTSDDHERRLARNRSLHDGALPAGAGVAVELLCRLAVHRADPRFREAAERALAAGRPSVARAPAAHVSMLMGAELARSPLPDVAILGSLAEPGTRELLAVVRRSYRPRPAIQLASEKEEDPPPLVAGKSRIDGRATAYLCREGACRRPTSDPAELARQLAGE